MYLPNLVVSFNYSGQFVNKLSVLLDKGTVDNCQLTLAHLSMVIAVKVRTLAATVT